MERNLLNELKYQYKNGGSTIKLIFINVSIFLIINIINVFFSLVMNNESVFIDFFTYHISGLHTNLIDFIKHPWGLFISIFSHYDFMHLLFNMIFLYFSGKIFEQIFNSRRLILIYIIGGLTGGIFEVIAHTIFPKLQIFNDIIVGASGSIMAIFIATAFYRPNLKLNLFGILPVRIILLAGIFITFDLLALGKEDGTAHFAHLGGSIIGLISIKNINKPNNLINLSDNFWNRFIKLFKNRNTKLKIHKKNSNNKRFKTDEEYNLDNKNRQDKIDKILDKISKSGYESLSKKEKDYLFKQSNQ